MSDHDERLQEVEQMTLNNTINFEVLLDLLIKANVLTEEKFIEAKQALEKQIQQQMTDSARQHGSGPNPQVGD